MPNAYSKHEEKGGGRSLDIVLKPVRLGKDIEQKCQ